MRLEPPELHMQYNNSSTVFVGKVAATKILPLTSSHKCCPEKRSSRETKRVPKENHCNIEAVSGTQPHNSRA